MLTDFSVGILVGVFFAAFVLAVVLFKYGRREKRKRTKNRNGNRAASITDNPSILSLFVFQIFECNISNNFRHILGIHLQSLL